MSLDYLSRGLSVLPALVDEKRPALAGWKQYQNRLPTEKQVGAWFADATGLCLLTGSISGNLEMIDFDHEGELFENWCSLVETDLPGLLGRLVIERSQSGGRHVIYRNEGAVSGNRKLAQRLMEVESSEPVLIAGKRYVPRRIDGKQIVTFTLIETRGEGGLFLCAPSPGYQIEQGSLTDIPTISESERSVLIEAACSLNESLPKVSQIPKTILSDRRPGDEYNESGDIRELLTRHGWEQIRGGENEHWRRPGKSVGCSATLRDRVFYVFSSNATPFEPDRAYAPFSVYALLEHQGDFIAAATALRQQGLGEQGAGITVDLSGLLATCEPETPKSSIHYPDPGPLPESLCHIPGFVASVIEHCLATAPYPNVPLAFCGALALQALLAGRKVRDEADNRTNIYLLALGYSAVGKDWARKLNTAILHKVGLVNSLGERFASGEGIQDSLFLNPSMLYQTDEIDGLLQSINQSRDARHENILGTLLTMYSVANSIYPMRRKAGKEAPGVINQPCLVVYGTAIPTHYYGALSERMLTNGFFARMLIVESGPRGTGQDPGIIEPPQSVIETAQWWSDFRPGTGNLENWHPQPAVVPATEAAKALLRDSRLQAEQEYSAAEASSDPVGTTVWGRVHEQTRKLALLYSVSQNHLNPVIDAPAVTWANEFVMHQTRRMLFMAGDHVSRNSFDAMAKELIRYLKKWRDKHGDKLMPEWELTRRLPWRPSDHKEVIELVEKQQLVRRELYQNKTRSGFGYRLLEN
ncbi:MAG TPA: bifunctional DNA primase/polymerase [Pirellulaceae bacterium]|nr:bifunctional DNA primase/polymerase [Pirellulaceae bacterium]